MIVAGNKIYEQCGWCNKLVKMTGWFGGMHLCLTDEERVAKSRTHQSLQQGQLGAVQGSVKLGELMKQLSQPVATKPQAKKQAVKKATR